MSEKCRYCDDPSWPHPLFKNCERCGRAADPSRVWDYQIIMASTTNKLTESVKHAMSQGWVPQGGVATSEVYYPEFKSHCSVTFAQAMIKTTP